MNPSPALVFDLDGTLSDPAEGIGKSINFALSTYGFQTIDLASVSRFIGPPLDESFRSMCDSASPDMIVELVAKFRERYADLGYAENALYPGIPKALGALAENGTVLGVCTSKRADFAEKILQLFGLRGYFTFVSGGDVGVRKGEQLASLLKAGAIGSNARMIGDRAVDVMAARENGLQSVGVLWGHGSLVELQEAGANLILRSVSDLHTLHGENAV